MFPVKHLGLGLSFHTNSYKELYKYEVKSVSEETKIRINAT